LVEVLFTRVTVSGLLFDWFSFINRLQIEQNLNIRSCTSSWASISAIGHIGFRFAPKLHGILTKAQAVLQLFSLLAYVASGEIVNFMCHYLILLAKRLMHYQVG
jgi:hypothetical protein